MMRAWSANSSLPLPLLIGASAVLHLALFALWAGKQEPVGIISIDAGTSAIPVSLHQLAARRPADAANTAPAPAPLTAQESPREIAPPPPTTTPPVAAPRPSPAPTDPTAAPAVEKQQGRRETGDTAAGVAIGSSTENHATLDSGDEGAFTPAVQLSERCPPPLYPRKARLEQRSGKVRILVGLNECGTVISTRILSSSGHFDLDRIAEKTVRKRWHFRPAHRGTRAVASELRVEVSFVLHQS